MDKRLSAKEEIEFLKKYNPGDYEKPSVTADVLVFTTEEQRLQILLVKRGQFPYMNYWAIPGGFVSIEESAFEAAKRELFEETGVQNVHLEQLYTFSEPERDPRMRVISVSYMATVPKNKIEKHHFGDDADATEIFDIFFNEKGELQLLGETDGMIVTEDMLAFDHKKIIKIAIQRLRGKIDYTPIAFEFLNDKNSFTLRELYDIFLAVTQKKEDFSNFRKKIISVFSSLIEETGLNDNNGSQGHPSRSWKYIETERQYYE